MNILIYDRNKKITYTQKQYKNKQLLFLYNRLLGRLLLKLFISTKLFSKINAIYNSSTKSTKKIQPLGTSKK